MEASFLIAIVVFCLANIVFTILNAVNQGRIEDKIDEIRKNLHINDVQLRNFLDRIQTVDDTKDEVKKIVSMLSKQCADSPSRPNNWDNLKASFNPKPMKVASDE